MKKEQLYEDIFDKLLIMDDEETKKFWQLNKEKTAANFCQLFGVEKEIIIKLLTDDYYHTAYWSFPVKSTGVFKKLLNLILKKNFHSDDNDFQKKFDLYFFQKIEAIYHEYQELKKFSANLVMIEEGTKLKHYPIVIDKIKEKSNFNFRITPEEQLDDKMLIVGLETLTKILINKGLEPIKKIFDIKNNDLLIENINNIDHFEDLPAISGYKPPSL